MKTKVIDFTTLLENPKDLPSSDWQARVILSDECISYVAWNTKNKEALLIDPKLEDRDAYENLFAELSDYLWIAVIDTHTHADHVSCGADIAKRIGAPYTMSEKAVSPRVELRISAKPCVEIPAKSGPIRFVATPGHTPDSLTVIWGPFIFGGDTILYGDVGRDDLPGGSPADHYESIKLLKNLAQDQMILLPGHDNKGGRISTWKLQLEKNSSLSEDRETYIREASAFDAPAPALLKKSLRENFK